MFGLIIDVLIVLIVALCAYRGFKRGIVRGVVGFVVLLLSLVVASSVSSAFAEEFVGVVQPFVGGLVDSQIQKILMPDDDTPVIVDDAPVETEDTPVIDDEEPTVDGEPVVVDDEPAADGEPVVVDDEPSDGEGEPVVVDDGPAIVDILPPSLSAIVDGFDIKTTYGMAMLTLKNLGFIDSIAESLSTALAKETSAIGVALGDAISAKLSLMLTRIALFAVAFILLAMIFAVIGNLITIVFSLPGLKTLDHVSGAVMGVLRGLLIVLFAAAVLRFFGIVTSGFVEQTTILELFVLHNPIANALKF